MRENMMAFYNNKQDYFLDFILQKNNFEFISFMYNEKHPCYSIILTRKGIIRVIASNLLEYDKDDYFVLHDTHKNFDKPVDGTTIECMVIAEIRDIVNYFHEKSIHKEE